MLNASDKYFYYPSFCNEKGTIWAGIIALEENKKQREASPAVFYNSTNIKHWSS